MTSSSPLSSSSSFLRPEEEITSAFLVYICTLQYVVLHTKSPQWLVSLFALVRAMYHTSFWFVVAGVVYSDAPLREPLLGRVAIVYLSFNVLLYGGIYTMNAITDMDEDRRHPTKRLRPLPSGDVPLWAAFAFMFGAWALGFAIAYRALGMRTVLMYACFWSVNVVYSFVARHIPIADTLCNAVTYGLRVHLGCVIRDGDFQWSSVVAGVLVGTVMASARRLLEKKSLGWTNRAVNEWIRAQWWLMMVALTALAILWAVASPRWLSTRLLCVGMWFAFSMIGDQRALFAAAACVVMVAQMWTSWGAPDREPYRAETLVVLLMGAVVVVVMTTGGGGGGDGGGSGVVKRIIEKTFL